ncbi:Scr1 family TA system antitoxin-like transcriptional regulator [Natronoglycomyces albus]|uniref:Helix-turn-helix transcriptional regulator n=1 Tax=Natronoglycomyces albus TaxID=2811108 RepID=A0A895XKW3_9ACTN|nr:Scr1 family TA system antitoxin-like transcriptional regulator [Natronoglycomyces albus]QSB05707.1 helix-turn-helix transcriptional regulator [Natronoglycomyces albus]
MTHSAHHRPTLAGRILANRIEHARKRAKLSMGELAKLAGYHTSTISRIEACKQGVSRPQLDALVKHLSLSKAETSEVYSLQLRSKERGWWEPFSEHVLPVTPLFVETEQAANRIDSVELQLVPGLLQTEDYTREVQVAEGYFHSETKYQINRELRLQRQKHIFYQEDIPSIRYLLGPAVFVYLNNLPSQIREPQLERIKERASLPEVDIRMLDQLSGANVSFTLLTLDFLGDETGTVLHSEQVGGERMIEERRVVSRYADIFERTFAQAVTLEEYLT